MKKSLLVVMVLLLSFTFIFNVQPLQATDAEEAKITVYISGPEGMINKLEAAFEEQHGDVLDMNIMGCGQLRTKVWTESQAGTIEADVIWGSDPLLYNLLDENDFLQPLVLNDAEMILEEYQVTDRNYALVNERYIVILYNSEMIDEADLPTSFADLADPMYMDLIAKADASQSSTAFAIATAFYEMAGNTDDYFQALKDNNVILMKSNGSVATGVMEGQFTLGIAPYDPIVRLNNKGKKQGFEVPMSAVWPSDGAVAIQRPVAIPVSETRTEAEQATAEAFVNFLLSKQAQNMTVQNGFVSVRSDVENVHRPVDAAIFDVDWDMGIANEEMIKDAYQNIFH